MDKPLKQTKTNFERYLNNIGIDPESDDMIIAGKKRKGAYGSTLRRLDPIAFEVGYQDWKRTYFG